MFFGDGLLLCMVNFYVNVVQFVCDVDMDVVFVMVVEDVVCILCCDYGLCVGVNVDIVLLDCIDRVGVICSLFCVVMGWKCGRCSFYNLVGQVICVDQLQVVFFVFGL